MQHNHTPHSLLQSVNQSCHINCGLQSLSKDRRENPTTIKNVTAIISVLKFYILETLLQDYEKQTVENVTNYAL
jgi:flagellar motor switch protein FliG